MSDGVDVIKELQLEDIDEKSISRTGHRAERVSAEVLFVVRPQPFRQHVRNLAVVEAVRAYEEVVHSRILHVDHAKVFSKVFRELRLADCVGTLDSD